MRAMSHPVEAGTNHPYGRCVNEPFTNGLDRPQAMLPGHAIGGASSSHLAIQNDSRPSIGALGLTIPPAVLAIADEVIE